MRALLAAALLLLTTSAAHADGERTYSVSAMGGYAGDAVALWTDVAGRSPTETPNLYRYGFGVRAGVSIPKLYLGAALVHHVGYTESGRGVGSSYDARYHQTLFGPEIGYDAHFGQYFMIRPYVGAGVLFSYSRTTVSGVQKNDDAFRFHITPGFLFGVRTGNVTFGVDLRAVLSPIDVPEHWAPGVFGTVGVAF